MLVESLSLRDFRNYACARVTLAPGLNLLVGANGQGKTNLLEAIHLISGRNPPRFGGNAQLIRWGSDTATAEATITAGGAEPALKLELDRRGRRLFVNGKKTRALSDSPLVATLFCPETLRLVKEGAQARRELADDLIERLRPAYGRTRSEYGRVLRQRNKILQRPGSAAQLDVWDERLCELGAEIVAERAEIVRVVSPLVSEAYGTLSGEGRPAAASYESRLVGDDNGHEAIARRMAASLAARRADEFARGFTLVGPHRDDVELTLDGHALRGFGSQGEQRTAALALVLAEARVLAEATGAQPVMLLDDVVSELDDERRKRLLKHLAEGRQVIITATSERATGAALPNANVIRVCRGQVKDG